MSSLKSALLWLAVVGAVTTGSTAGCAGIGCVAAGAETADALPEEPADADSDAGSDAGSDADADAGQVPPPTGACVSWVMDDDAPVSELDVSSPPLRAALREALSCCTPFEGRIGPFGFGEGLTFRRDGGARCETLAQMRQPEGGGLSVLHVCDFREVTDADLAFDDESRIYESLQQLLETYCTEREGPGRLGLLADERCRAGSDIACVESAFCQPDAEDTCEDRGGACAPLVDVCGPGAEEPSPVCTCSGRRYDSSCEARQMGAYGPLSPCGEN